MRWSAVLFAMSLTLPLASQAAIYKCTNSQGQVSFQEQPCPQNSKTKEVNIKGSRQMSVEEETWMKERSSMVNTMCNDLLTQKYGQHELLRQACACTTRRYFANPIGKLRELERTGDAQANTELINQAVASCSQELKGQSVNKPSTVKP